MSDFLSTLPAGNLLGLYLIGSLYLPGRVAAISGLMAEIIKPQSSFKIPAFYFVLAIVILALFFKQQFSPMNERNTAPWLLLLAGLIMDIGVRMRSGCTSGHAIWVYDLFSSKVTVKV